MKCKFCVVAAAGLLLGAVGGVANAQGSNESKVVGEPIIVGDSIVSGIVLIDNERADRADSVVTKKGLFNKIGGYFKESNQDKSFDKKFDFSIIGGPHYSSDVKFGLGIVAAGLFRTDRTDLVTQPSNISIYGDLTTSGSWVLGIRGNTLFKRGKHRLDYVVAFASMPTYLWGIGYEKGRDNSNKSKFHLNQFYLEVDYMYMVANKFYVGATTTLSDVRGSKVEDLSLLEGQSTKQTNRGVGIFMLYDSRDVYTNPYKGWYFKLETIGFPTFLGNKPQMNRTELTLDYYHRVWKGGVLAYDLHGEYNSGNVPWTMLAQMGGSRRMRGYYEGRYRDKALAEIQVELRQRVWRRIGVTGWVGAGNIFSEFSKFQLSQTLPNYGVGFRWEFKKRVNVRLDYGMGKNDSSFIFSINEAF